MINHRGRILIFGLNLNFSENRFFEQISNHVLTPRARLFSGFSLGLVACSVSVSGLGFYSFLVSRLGHGLVWLVGAFGLWVGCGPLLFYLRCLQDFRFSKSTSGRSLIQI